jgi:hypothetical protein
LLKAFHDVEARGYIYYPFDLEETRSYWNKSSDPYYAFVEDCIIFESTASTLKKNLYSAFITWCTEKKLATKNSNIFSREIYKYLIIHGVQDGRKTVEGKNIRAWNGLRLTNQEEKDQDQQTLDE